MATNNPTPVEASGAYSPQDYSLKTLNFLTASGNRIELKKIMLEFSYYEDIYTFAASGYVTLLDAQGFIELLQLSGNEYLEVNFGKIKNSMLSALQSATHESKATSHVPIPEKSVNFSAK